MPDNLLDLDEIRQADRPTPEEKGVPTLKYVPPTASDVDLDAIRKVPQMPDPEQPAPQFDLAAQMRETVTPYVEYYKAQYNQGNKEIARGFGGMDAILGSAKYEDIRDRFSETALDEMEKRRINSFENTVPLSNPLRWFGPAFNSLAYMQQTIGAQFRGGAIGAGVGALGGAALGAAAGTGAAALAGPAAPIVEGMSVRTGAIEGAKQGWTWGGRAEAFRTATGIMAGQHYMTLRDAGVGHEKAKSISLAVGATQALIETAQLHQLTGLGKKQVQAYLKSKEGTTLLKNSLSALRDIGGNVAIETGEEELQQLIDIAGRLTAGQDENIQALKLASSENKTGVNPGRELWDTFVNSVQASVVMGAGSYSTGKLTGKLLSGYLKNKEDTSPVKMGDTLGFLSETLDDAQNQLNQKILTGVVSNTETKGETYAPGSALAAEQDRQQAQEAVMTLNNQIVGMELAGQEVPTELRQELKSLRKAYRASVEAKDIAVLNEAKEQLDSALSDPEAGKEDRAKLLKEAKSVEKKLHQLQLDKAEREVEKRLADIDKEIKDRFKLRAAELESRIDELEKQATSITAPDLVQLKRNILLQASDYKDDLSILRNAEKAHNAGTLTPTQAKSMLGNRPALTRLLNQLDDAYERQSKIETFRDLVRDEALDSRGLAELNVKISAASAQGLANLASKAVLRASRESILATRKSVKQNQSLLKKIVQNSGLPKNAQASLLARIVNLQTAAQVRAALPSIEEQIQKKLDRIDLMEARAELQAVLDKTKPREINKHVASKVSASVQAILNTYREFIESPEKAKAFLAAEASAERADARAEDANNNAADYNIRAARTTDAAKRFIAEQTEGVESMSPDQLRALASEISRVLRDGKSERIDALEQRKLNLESKKAKVAERIQGDKTYSQIALENVDGFKKKLRTWKRVAFNSISTWPGLMNILDQHDARKDGSLADYLKVDAQQNAERVNVNKYLEDMVNTVAGDGVKLVKAMADRMVSGNRKQYWGSYVELVSDENGTKTYATRELVATRNELIQMYLQFQDDELTAGLTAPSSAKGNGYTLGISNDATKKTTQELLEESLTDEDKKLAKGLQEFYRKYFARINEYHLKKYGVPMAKNDFYSGQAKRMLDKEQQEPEPGSHEDMLNAIYDRKSLTPGSTIARTKNAIGLKRQDAFANAVEHVAKFEHWLAWDEKAKEIQYIFGDAKVQQLITDKYGGDFLRAVQDAYKQLIGVALQNQNKALAWIGRIRRNAGSAFVGAKLAAVPKQFTAVLYYLHYINGRELIDGMNYYWSNRAQMDKIFDQSDFVKARGRDLKLQLTGDISSDATRFKIGMSFTEALMLPVQWGDMLTVRAGGTAVMLAAYRKAIADGKSNDEASRIALAQFEEIANRTQSSSTPDQQTALERAGEVGKMFMLFRKQSVQALMYELDAVRRAASKPTAENVTKLVRTVAVNRAAQAAFQAVAFIEIAVLAAATGGDPDEKNAEAWRKFLAAAVTGAWTGVPILGDVLNADATKIANYFSGAKDKTYDVGLIPLDAVARSVHLSDSVTKALDEYRLLGETPSALEIFNMLHDVTRGPALAITGMPMDALIKLTEQTLVSDDTRTEISKSDREKLKRYNEARKQEMIDAGQLDEEGDQ